MKQCKLEVHPYRGLTIITTADDEKQTEFLLSGQDKMLICDQCESTSFRAEAIIVAEIVITGGEVPIIDDDVDKDITVIKLLECARCGCKDFIMEDLNKSRK
jgi:hypothetical protein